MECWFHQTGPSGPTSNPDHISHIAKRALRCLLNFRSGHPGGWALSCEMLSCPRVLESLESLEGPPRKQLQDLFQPVSPGVPGVPGGPSWLKPESSLRELPVMGGPREAQGSIDGQAGREAGSPRPSARQSACQRACRQSCDVAHSQPTNTKSQSADNPTKDHPGS